MRGTCRMAALLLVAGSFSAAAAEGEGEVSWSDPTCGYFVIKLPTDDPSQAYGLFSVKGLPPTLVISTTNDPATPYQAGVDLAKQLGGTLVTFEGTQHTVAFQGNACIDDIVATYLVDVKVPAPDTRC